MHGAGATLGNAATVFGPGQAEGIAQDPQQGSPGLGIDLIRFAIDA
jgi:hypothetical protein